MRKLFTVLLALIAINAISLAQNKLLVADGTSPNLYITHTIEPKENYYSVGRLYNFSPKELAAYNNLPFDKGLTLGETIKIPLTQNNFSQGEAAKENEALVPVYHVMQAKEGLYRVSVNYNKVPLDVLKKWNRLSGDAVSTGSKLIVGYLKVLKDQSPLASKAVNVTPTEIASNLPTDTKKKTRTEIRAEKELAKKAENNVEQTTETLPSVIEKTPEVTTVSNRSTINFNGGKFRSLFTDQTKNKSLVFANGTAASFKTTSGWQDGKYYCFHNTALPGTIIKITNNANGKSIYAKVLGEIPDIKQTNSLVVSLSNSAANELGAGEGKFECSLEYAK
jgi:LysM repeat protein/uncharacterized protein (UPF0333 family)